MYKIWRYYKAPYDHTPDMVCSETIETIRCDEIYSDEILAQVASNGFNGIWLDAHLYDLVRHDVFPEFGKFADRHIAAINRLISKAGSYGVKVFLCMQPGRGVTEHDKDFWAAHAEFSGSRFTMETRLWGAKGDTQYTDLISICTSHEPVKRYLKESFAELGEKLPGLGGCILLTASEFNAHCMSFKLPAEKTCPVCAARGAEEVISEVIDLAASGLHSTNKEAAVIAWDWGWHGLADPLKVIERIKSDVIIMPNFESGLRGDVCGKKDYLINEYSLSFTGPSDIFQAEIAAAEKKSLRWMARLQIGTTHEIGNVSNLPLMKNLFGKADFMRRHNSSGFMGCWNFGNMFSANTTGFNWFLSEDSPENCREALVKFAENYFGSCDGEKIADSWEYFSDVMHKNFPFDNPFMYAGPIPWAAGYFSPPGAMQGQGGLSFSTRMGNDRGDHIPGALTHFSPAELLPSMEKVADGAEKAAEMFKEALGNNSGKHALEELSAIFAVSCSYRSTVNFLKILLLKEKYGEVRDGEYLEIQRNELANVEKLLPYLKSDERQGFHAEARAHFYDAARVEKKIAKLKDLLNLQ